MAWTTPKTWPALTNLTASEFNVHIRDNLNAITTWETYSPSLLNWTVSDGTLSGEYIHAGELVHVRIHYVVGASDTQSGNLQISLPVAAEAMTTSSVYGTPLGTVFLFDDSATDRRNWFGVLGASGSAVAFANLGGDLVDASTPWSWGTDDELSATLSYKAA